MITELGTTEYLCSFSRWEAHARILITHNALCLTEIPSVEGGALLYCTGIFEENRYVGIKMSAADNGCSWAQHTWGIARATTVQVRSLFTRPHNYLEKPSTPSICYALYTREYPNRRFLWWFAMSNATSVCGGSASSKIWLLSWRRARLLHYINVSSSPRLPINVVTKASVISILALLNCACITRQSKFSKWQFSASNTPLLSFSYPSFPYVSVNAPAWTNLRCSHQSTPVIPSSRGEWQLDASFDFAVMTALVQIQQIRHGRQRTGLTSLTSVDIPLKHSQEKTAILPVSLATPSQPRMKRTFRTGGS